MCNCCRCNSVSLNEKFMRSYYSTYNSEDADALAEFYHADVELVTEEGARHGAENLLATYRGLIAQFHDNMTPLHISIQENTATVEILARFTAKQPVADFFGFAMLPGESIDLRLRGSYEFMDGKFTRVRIEMLQMPASVRRAPPAVDG